MPSSYILKGLLTGFIIAAPVGPVTVLVIHRIVKQSFGDGVLSGFGVAIADGFYGLLAGFGAGYVMHYVLPHEYLLRVFGGLFLFYWGYRIFVSKFAESHPLVKERGWGGPLVSTFILTLTNPITILAFGAVLVGMQSSGMRHHPVILLEWAIGIGLGSLCWWLLLGGIVRAYKARFNFKILIWVNRITGAIVIAAGCGIFLDLVKLVFFNH